jgi:hypothetical protein
METLDAVEAQFLTVIGREAQRYTPQVACMDKSVLDSTTAGELFTFKSRDGLLTVPAIFIRHMPLGRCGSTEELSAEISSMDLSAFSLVAVRVLVYHLTLGEVCLSTDTTSWHYVWQL